MRVAIHFEENGVWHVVVDAEAQIYCVDERSPTDRVYQLTTTAHNVTRPVFDRLIRGPVFRLGDKPRLEHRIRASLRGSTRG